MTTENRRIDIKSLLIGTLMGASIILSIAAGATSGNRTTWEYKVVQGRVFGSEVRLEDAINSQTAQGWEFVSASHSVDQFGFAVMRREKK